MKTIKLIGLLLVTMACQPADLAKTLSAPETEAPATEAKGTLPEEEVVVTPEPETSEEEVVVSRPELTVFKNWDHELGFTLELKNRVLDYTYIRYYDVLNDGTAHTNHSSAIINYPVRRVNKCIDRVVITGTKEKGTITITTARPEYRYNLSDLCTPNNGTYEFEVTEAGLWFGRQGEAARLYREIE